MREIVFEAKGLTKVYRTGDLEVRALAGVDLEFYAGELVVLLGPSGSGKSTLLNILGGLDWATSGQCRFRDHDLTSEDDHALTLYRRDHVGFVFQFYNPIPSLTARENVALTTVVITHNAAIKDIAHRVIYFADGRIARTVENEHRLPPSEISWLGPIGAHARPKAITGSAPLLGAGVRNRIDCCVGFRDFDSRVGSYRSLCETRSAYYERNAFADVFATLVRAPKSVGNRMLEIPGVVAADLRIMKPALLDIEVVNEPASGLALSLPDNEPGRLNYLCMRTGHAPEPGKADEVVVNEAFAAATGLEPGARIKANLNGQKRDLMVVGIALPPEFIYALAPGEIVPDDRRYCTLWMSEKALAALFDLEGAFNAVALKLLPGANQEQAIDELDRILERNGGIGAHGRDIHQSHAFIDSKLM